MTAEEQLARVGEIEELFAARGWRLRYEREDAGVWTAIFYPALSQAVVATEVSGRSQLDAAEAAWAKYLREPWLGGPLMAA